MYCSQCGKKVAENMLFCPFCGVPIVIPDQEDAETPEAAKPAEPKASVATPKQPEPELPPFEPLKLDDDEPPKPDWRADIAQKKADRAEQKAAEQKGEVRLDGVAPRLDGSAPGSEGATHRNGKTFVPPKPMDPEKLFLDEDDAYDRDEYDQDDDDDYDDDDEGGFFARHARGLIGFTLLIVLFAVFIGYLFTDAGQRALAKANLAWRTGIYSELGYENYQAGEFAQAGLYYEHALERDPSSYSNAQSAAASYLEGGDTEKAAAMLRRCIEINPTAVEPYVYLKNLYPNASQRPWDITQLLQGAYAATGDSRVIDLDK